jgi:hypothetical protein
MLGEKIRILKQEPVTRIGIDMEMRMWQHFRQLDAVLSLSTGHHCH